MTDRKITRADFFKVSAAGLASLSLAPSISSCTSGTASAAPVRKSLGLQIYSLGDELYQGSLEANFKRLKEMGYDRFELFGYTIDGKIHGYDMMDFTKMAEDCGIKSVSTHVNPPSINSEERLSSPSKWIETVVKEMSKVAEDHVKMGVRYLVQPMMPFLANIPQVLTFCDSLNAIGKVAKEAGIPFGYHHHNMEYAYVSEDSTEFKLPTAMTSVRNGRRIIDLLMENTDPDLVFLELDAYWTVVGQTDPVAMLRKYSDRIKLLHVQDDVYVGGSGMMNFKSIFEQFYANNLDTFFVEIHDTTSGIQFDRAEASAKYLNEAAFVK